MRLATIRVVRLVIAMLCCLPVWHANANVLVDVQPTNQTVSVGETVNFGATVITTAGEVITGYKWFVSANSQGPFNQIGNSAALILPNVGTGDAGYYYATVTYQSGGGSQSASSSKVTLIVNRQPRIVTQPVSLIKPVTSNAVFSVVVSGSLPLTFQWRQNGTNLADDGRITGSTGTNLAIQNLTAGDTGDYDIVVTNLYGGATSQVATLQVIVAPPVITSPASATGKQGHAFSYSMTASGTLPITFGATNLPDGLSVNPTNGVISGVPQVYGIFAVGLYATNAAQTNAGSLVLTLADDIPSLTSATNALGRQGAAFSYTITATNDPAAFSADPLPDGLLVDPASGIISGVPLVSGSFAITIGATNDYGSSQKILTLTLISGAPGITSALVKSGKQGVAFSYTITASNNPASFSTSPLPDGLLVDPATGIISGVPLVNGSFAITIGATNAFGSDSKTLTLNLASGLPVITSALVKNGKQGVAFSYTITATNNPASFSTGPLPSGLNLNPVTGVISGVPLVSGVFPVTIAASNVFGSDSKTLTLNLASGVPVITSALTASGVEVQPGFLYTIKASNTPVTFSATALPMGLTVNTNTGAITGTPLYAGNYSIPISAANIWGVGTATLQLTVSNAAINNLVIDNVLTNYASPYLVEFKFALFDGADPLTRHAVVAAPALMSATAFEDGVPVSPTETAVILHQVNGRDAKVLKYYLVLDFTASIASLANGDTNGNGISDAIDAEVAAAQNFVNQQPAGTQIGVYEFHRDDEAPQQVVPLTTDTNLLDNAIGGIWTNYVQNFPAGSRAWDALTAAITAFGPATNNEDHVIIFMSDGSDDSSTATLDGVITAAMNAAVQIYGVGLTATVDTTTFQTLTSSTLGRYFEATNLPDVALGLDEIGKDLRSQYILRWATLKRSASSFMPTFQISYQGLTAGSPPNPPPFISGTNFVTVTNGVGVVSTNTVFLFTTNYIIPPYKPTLYAGNLLAGSLQLVTDPGATPPGITLRTTYVPRYIRQLRLHYRANWPATVTLKSTNAGELLAGWSLTQTNDGVGGQWVLLTSPDPSLLASSIPFADFGDLLTFSFHDPIVASNAFSDFAVDNTIYTNTASTNFYGFILQNTNSFIKVYPVPPPHGTPIPWLVAYGFTNNFAAAELLDPNGNGLAVWQDYLAGLNPLDPNATFGVQIGAAPNPPQIFFNTVAGRTYRVYWATSVNGPWLLLRDNIAGTGGIVMLTDLRNLSGVGGSFYRVGVFSP